VHDYDNGGHTKSENLVLMCRKHHDLMHKGKRGERKWKARIGPDGTFTVTSPDGQQRSSHPPGHLWEDTVTTNTDTTNTDPPSADPTPEPGYAAAPTTVPTRGRTAPPAVSRTAARFYCASAPPRVRRR
jgi:hypothetical protein